MGKLVGAKRVTSACYPNTHFVDLGCSEPVDFILGIGALASDLRDCERSVQAIQASDYPTVIGAVAEAVLGDLVNALENRRHLLELPSVQRLEAAFNSQDLDLDARTLNREIARLAMSMDCQLNSIRLLSVEKFTVEWLTSRKPPVQSPAVNANVSGTARADGVTYSQKPLIEELGCKPRTLSGYCRKVGIPAGRRGVRYSSRERYRILEFAASGGTSDSFIAKNARRSLGRN